jgi:D-hydroxyproline dehydrogenase subunit alpha
VRTDLTVIGAGPAGLAAAAAAAGAGLSVLVVDERLGPGGSVDGALGASARDPDAAWLLPPLAPDAAARDTARRLREAAADAGATSLHDALVWGLFPGFIAAVARAGRGTERVDSDQVVLATGEYVVRPPFSGFHLDGVLTPVGLVRALAQGLVTTGARVAVLGDDEVADAVLAALAAEGIGDVVALAERDRPAGVPLQVMAAPPVARARDGQRLDHIELTLAGGHTERRAVDWVVVTAPRAVASELAQLIGCEGRWEGYVRGFRPVHGRDGATSVPGLFLAGALTGAVDTAAAERSGVVAGLAAAARVGSVQAEAVWGALDGMAPPGPPPPALVPSVYRAVAADSAAVACRCVGTTVAEVHAAIADGARSIDDVKRQAKAGMGVCQGRDCHRAVVALLERAAGVDVATLRAMRVRPPVRPVTARAMFEGEVPA